MHSPFIAKNVPAFKRGVVGVLALAWVGHGAREQPSAMSLFTGGERDKDNEQRKAASAFVSGNLDDNLTYNVHRCNDGTWIEHRKSDVCRNAKGVDSCPTGCQPKAGAKGLYCVEIDTGKECHVEVAIFEEKPSEYHYVGCFANSGKARLKHHKLGHTLAECAEEAKADRKIYFGLEYPQGFKAGSHKAACLILDELPRLKRTSDKSCEAEVYHGARLGSGMRLAVYTTVKFRTGSFLLQHNNGKYVSPEKSALPEDFPHLALYAGHGAESRFTKVRIPGSDFFVLKHCSGKCIHAQSVTRRVEDGVYLALFDGCKMRDKSFHFKVTSVADDGSFIIQHRSSRMCVVPEDNSALTLHVECKRSTGNLYFQIRDFVEDDTSTCIITPSNGLIVTNTTTSATTSIPSTTTSGASITTAAPPAPSAVTRTNDGPSEVWKKVD